jgi:hypothetical protein
LQIHMRRFYHHGLPYLYRIEILDRALTLVICSIGCTTLTASFSRTRCGFTKYLLYNFNQFVTRCDVWRAWQNFHIVTLSGGPWRGPNSVGWDRSNSPPVR